MHPDINPTAAASDRVSNFYYYTALACAIWFLLTSAAWTYMMNVIFSFPFGIVSFSLWMKGRKIEFRQKRFRKIWIILAAGLISAGLSFLYFMVWD